MRWFKFLAILPLLSLASSVTLPKQFQQFGYGGIEGFVVDQAGIPVVEASVQVCNTMRGNCSGTVSQANGFYRITGLVAGRYTLWAEAKRYTSEWMPVIVVEEGQMMRQDIQLRREIPTIELQPERGR